MRPADVVPIDLELDECQAGDRFRRSAARRFAAIVDSSGRSGHHDGLVAGQSVRAHGSAIRDGDGIETPSGFRLEHHLEPHRALVLVGWLDDLKTVLPAHSGQAVADSLGRWVRWGEEVDLGTLDRKAVNETARVLQRCGQRWRALLSGEKDATDALEIGDYVSAAQGTLARRARSLGRWPGG